MKLSIEEVTKRTLKVLLKIKPDSHMFVPENFKKPLTNSEMGFKRQDMVYLFLELMDEFKIRFDKEDVIDYRFNTIRNIIDIIHHKVG